MSPEKRRLCPILNDALDDCYVSDMNSRNIEKVIHFCGMHHEECEIYRRISAGNRNSVPEVDTGFRHEPEPGQG